ncbi:MAG TPA: CHAT domain-containing protein [Pyrinomonadaceae bacterium]
MAEHLDILSRCRQVGVDTAFAELYFKALGLPPESFADFAEARAINDRMSGRQTPEALSEAIAARKRLLARPSFRQDPRLYNQTLLEQGAAHAMRFESQRDSADLKLAIKYPLEALAGLPAGTREWAYAQGNLARAYRMRYDLSRDVGDLDGAASAYQLALSVLTEPTSDRAISLIGLGAVLWVRSEVTGRAADLDAAIKTLGEGISLVPEGTYEWARGQNNLGLALLSRFRRTGQITDIDGAAAAHAQAVGSLDENAPQVGLYVGNYATALVFHFQATGQPDDLRHAFAALELALSVTPEGSFDWARWQNTLGLAYSRRFEISGDMSDLEQALAAFRRALGVSGEDSPNVITYRANLQEALRAKSKITGDVAELDEAVEALRKTLERAPAGSLFRAEMESALASALRARFDAAERVEDLQSAIELLKGHITEVASNTPVWAERQASLARALITRFEALGDAEDIETAVALLRQASAAVPQLNHVRATYESNLGIALWLRYQVTLNPSSLDGAVEALRRALSLLTRSRTLERARMLGNLGLALSQRFSIAGDKQDIDEAADALREALSVSHEGTIEQARWRSIYGQVLVQGYRGLGRAAALDEAVSVLGQAAAAGRDGSLYKATWQSNYGQALTERFVAAGRRDDALAAFAAFEPALRACDPELSPRLTLDAAKAYGRLLFAHSRWQEAARVCELGARALSSLYRAQVREHSREAWLTQSGDMSTLAAYSFARVGRLREAVAVLEAGRARALSESLARDRTDLEEVRKSDPEALAAYLRALARLRLLEVEERQAVTLGAADEGPSAAALRANLRQTRDAIDKAIERIRRIPGHTNFLSEPDWGDVVRAVEPGKPLVYLLTTVAGSLALVVSRAHTPRGGEVSVEPVWFDNFTEVELRKVMSEWLYSYGVWRDDRRQKAQWFETIEHVTGGLGRRLMKRLTGCLRELGAEEAVLVACGLWPLLPLHSAWTESEGGGRVYALDEVAFGYAPSARALTYARVLTEAAGDARSLLVVEDPAPLTSAAPLPSLRLGLKAVASLFAEPEHLAGEEATLTRVTEGLGRARVVHFACHGAHDWETPLGSGLLMANDERLTVGRLFDLRIGGARLATLAACETGLVGTHLPDEAVSLPSALMQSGFAGAAASLWAVTDVSTALLMESFYKLWREDGQPPPIALREAQRRLRDAKASDLARRFREERDRPAPSAGLPRQQATSVWRWLEGFDPDERPFAHPFYWAAFGYTGV